MLEFAVETKTRWMLGDSGYMHVYLGMYTLWCSICAAVYMLHGVIGFFVAVGFSVSFLAHITRLSNVLWDIYWVVHVRRGKTLKRPATLSNRVVPLNGGDLDGGNQAMTDESLLDSD